MARVFLPQGLAGRAGGQLEHEVEGQNVRALLANLDARFPGLAADLEGRIAVAIDGEIYNDPFLEPLEEDSEVYLLPRVGGG